MDSIPQSPAGDEYSPNASGPPYAEGVSHTEGAPWGEAVLLDLMHEAVIGRDERGNICFWNQAAQELYGWTRAEAMGRNAHDLLQKEVFVASGQTERQSLEKGRWEGCIQQVKRDGSRITVESRLSLLNNGPGHPTYVLEINQDVTKRVQAEAELQSAHDHLEMRVQERTQDLEAASARLHLSEASFRQLTEVMPQIVWTARPDGFLDYYNERWVEYTGMSIEQTQGWGWQPVLHPDDVQRTTDIWQQAVESGESYEVEYRFKRASDGMYRWHLGRARPQRDEAGKIVKWFGTCTDIQDQKQAQQELERSYASLESRVQQRTAELVQANAMQQTLLVKLEHSNRELQEFASIASHDLQEPLRKIQAFGDRLKTKYSAALNDEGRDYIERMQNSAHRMRTLIEDLLAFSRVTAKAQPVQAVNLTDVMTGVLDDLEEALRESKGRVEVGELRAIQGDAGQMRQLFQNLISNALKFSKSEAAPVIRIYEDQAAAFTRDNREFCRIVVADNGIGFNEKYTDRIFQAFQRLHGRQEYSGTGIGLAICRKIVHHHGGDIQARSTPDVGSEFLPDLPLFQNATH